MTEPKRLGTKCQTQAVAIKWAAAADGLEANDADGKPAHKGGSCPSQRPLLRYLRFLSAKDQACPQLTLLALQSGSAHPFELYFLQERLHRHRQERQTDRQLRQCHPPHRNGRHTPCHFGNNMPASGILRHD